MYTGKALVHLLGKVLDSSVYPVNSWARSQRGGILCAKCFKLKREIFPRAIDIPLCQLPRGTSYDSTEGGGVIRNDVLEILRPHLPPHVLGRCFWKDGKLLGDYSSVYFRDFIVERAGENTRNYNYYECPLCGLIYMGSDDSYFLRRELPDAVVFQDQISCLYLADDLARTFPWSRFPDVRPVIYPVLEEPVPDDPFQGELPLRARGWAIDTWSFRLSRG